LTKLKADMLSIAF